MPKNCNALYGKLNHPAQIVPNITYYGDQNAKSLLVDEDTIVVHSNEFPEPWRNRVYGLKDSHDVEPQQNVDTYKKSLHWREFLKIQDQFLGGIKLLRNETNSQISNHSIPHTSMLMYIRHKDKRDSFKHH